MAVTNLSDISKAAEDEDLLDRLISAAAAEGIDSPEGWAKTNARRIVAEPITPDGDTAASVFAYAVSVYQPAPRPGQNPAAVTDAYLRAAVQSVHAAQQA